MFYTTKIHKNIWKIHGGVGLCCNIYLLTVDEPTLIDTGNKFSCLYLKETLQKIGIHHTDIKKVIFTHLHNDHCGCLDFPNAEFYASEEEIQSFQEDPKGTVLDERSSDNLKRIILKPLQKHPFLKIIKTPGHTKGSFCLYYEKEKILFSGDTLFDYGAIGRTDLPSSVPSLMEKSLEKLKKIEIKILCPGH